MFKKLLPALFLLTLTISIFATPSFATAQEPIINPDSPLYEKGDYGLNDILSLATWASTWILGIVGSLTLAMFVYGGFLMLTSAGSSEKVGEAKKVIIAAAIGLLIVFASYSIIRFVASSLGLGWSGQELKINSSATPGSSSSSVTEETCLNRLSSSEPSKTLGQLGFTCVADKTKAGYCLEGLCPNNLTCCAPSCESAGEGYECTTDYKGKSCKSNLCKVGKCCK